MMNLINEMVFVIVIYQWWVLCLLLGVPTKTLCYNNLPHNNKRGGFSLVLLFDQHIWTDCNSQSCLKNNPTFKECLVKFPF